MAADERDEATRPDEVGVVDALPGLARIYASAWRRTAEWTVSSSLRAASSLMRSAAGGEPPSELLAEAAAELRDFASRMVEIVDPDERATGEIGDWTDSSEAAPARLRARGEELLRRSADVADAEETHPAYQRILSELAPDEARILRLHVLEGPQPAVDVRAGLPFLSSLVAPGRNMIGAEAGCRFHDRVPAYLNNLYRLGLIWFSREPVSESLRYQVLEAQPDVLEALRKGGRTARTMRRSILLTPFGRDFCAVCLPLEDAATAPVTDDEVDGAEPDDAA